jgi:hypothetical protein
MTDKQLKNWRDAESDLERAIALEAAAKRPKELRATATAAAATAYSASSLASDDASSFPPAPAAANLSSSREKWGVITEQSDVSTGKRLSDASCLGVNPATCLSRLFIFRCSQAFG